MTPAEQSAHLLELINALKLLQTVEFDTPGKKEAAKFLEWAIRDLSKAIWYRNTKEATS
jgi:hypothetical protein